MSDYLTSVARTAVPALWGTALAALLARGVIGPELAAELAPLGVAVLAPLTIAAYYAAVRALEARGWLPGWAALVLLGWPVEPAYVGGRHALR